ncbi:MAG TPA: calcium-binding protein [Allosphingosinicella sp.]|nr:calcium-binding protein [Allosphingosinicella sp.]
MPTFNGTPDDDFLVGTSGDDDLHGFDGNDGLFGLEGNDLLDGGNGHDFMRGQEGNDQIFGGAEDDYLDGGEGDDLLDGGSGIDRASFAVGATVGVVVDLNIVGVAQNTGHGFDTLVGIEHLSGTRFSDILTGDGGDNWLWGGSDGSGITGDDIIAAGGGNDLVEVGTGNHNLDGGTGTDTLSLWGNNTDITAAGVTFSLQLQGSAQATGQGMMNASGFENLSGSIHADVLTGDGNDNVIAGDLSDDQLSGGNGSDTLYGDGRIIADTHDTGGSGPITTYADITLIDPLLVSGNDTLEGGDGDDSLHGGGGSDTASYASAGGAVFVDLDFGGASGAAGEDTFSGIENAIGSAFNDGLLGDGGDNALAGLAGHDFLRGFGGNDTLKGGDDDDFLNGGVGDDIIDGGAGIDRAAYSTGAVAGVTVDLNIVGVAQNTGSQGFDTLIGIEHVSGTRFSDVLTGDAGDNYVWGGSDTSGVTGDDILSAGAGNDLVQVGNGNHDANGGIGTDTLSLHGNGTDITAAGVTVSLALQGMVQATEQGMMTLSGFENLSGSAFDDFLGGNGGDNLLAGFSGADGLSGGDGADTLYGDGVVIIDTHDTGGSGPIVVYADVADLAVPEPGGNDVLNGGKGDDFLWGGGGDDVLTGGKGGDTFGFGPGDGDDRITDFEKNKDTILFEGIAGVDDFGDLTFTKVGSDVLVTWGTTDSILLEGVKLNQIHASDFMFG